jgi:hypothetical protein
MRVVALADAYLLPKIAEEFADSTVVVTTSFENLLMNATSEDLVIVDIACIDDFEIAYASIEKSDCTFHIFMCENGYDKAFDLGAYDQLPNVRGSMILDTIPVWTIRFCIEHPQFSKMPWSGYHVSSLSNVETDSK